MRSAKVLPSSSYASVLSETVRSHRRRLRLTQRELADLAGCGTDFLYDVERGKATLRLDKLVSLLGVLGLELCVRPRERTTP